MTAHTDLDADAMSEPFIFIGTHTLREGKLEDFKEACRELVEVVEANEPRLIAFNIYVNEDGTEATIVQVHPDPDSMLFHMQVAREHISEAYQSVLEKTQRIDVYGKLSDTVLEMIRQLAGSEIPLTLKTHHLGGFTRSIAGETTRVMATPERRDGSCGAAVSDGPPGQPDRGAVMEHAKVNGVELAYEVVGSGEPMLFIHGAHLADALQPLMAEPALERFQRIRYHRRGLGGSTRPIGVGPTSVAVQARDAVGLLDHVRVERAHLVGHSWGGAIALELAAQHPTRVASLVLLEPPFLTTPAGAAFGRAVAPLVDRYQAGDAEGAVHGFLALVGDRNWRATIDQTVPGAIDQAVKDAATFFETELPGPMWSFGPEQAEAITCPVLSVLGNNSSALFVESRQLLHAWFPACQDADIAGATHLLQMQAPRPVAEAIAAFL
jgi:pimeloyl-ACP methyl ester carboxylesterase/quinol monooxygenase YgiN